MTKKTIMVSACLMGDNTNYKGGNKYNRAVVKLSEKYNIIKVCPETSAGLPIPREPSEILEGTGNDVIERKAKVVSKSGNDVTAHFIKGAEITLALANKHNPEFIILKEQSPSCGVHKIYDGSFSGAKISGSGAAAALLKQNGYELYSEVDIEEILQRIS